MPDLAALLPFAPDLSEELGFILNLGAAVGAALLGGAVAVRLRQPAVVGYLAAGVLIGPATPGFVGDVEEIALLADVGVILLLFALGVQFSIRELREVARVAVPGGVLQIALTLATGALLAIGLGFDVRPALVVGACLSISSTLVVIKTLIDRGETDSLHGRAAIGWSIVQDIATIVFIVALPPLAGGDVAAPILLAVLKAGLFLAIAYVLGTRALPWIFAAVARLGSNELFLLTVVATALLTAFVSSAVFGLSLALGAFVGGILVSESELSYQAAAEVVPFRDLFAVLFFVSVGMLVDPGGLVADAPIVLLLVVLAVAGKGVATAAFGRLFGLPARSAVLLGASMAQVGEFSFILAEDALDVGLIDPRAYNLILGTAVVTILLSPFARRVGDVLQPRLEGPLPEGPAGVPAARAPARVGVAPVSRAEAGMAVEDEARRPSVVVLGAGRVGRVVVRSVRNRGFRCIVVDRDQRRLEEVVRMGAVPVYGDAANPEILRRLELDRARVVVVAIGDPLSARLCTQRVLALNPRVSVASRARGRREIETLRALGVGRVSDPEAEAAFELARHALQRMGVSGPELLAIVTGLRRETYGREQR